MQRERLTRLVEGDVPVLANTTKEELDTAISLDLLLVRLALLDEVLGVAVEDVHLRRRDVHCAGPSAGRARGKRGERGKEGDAPCEKNSRNMKVW